MIVLLFLAAFVLFVIALVLLAPKVRIATNNADYYETNLNPGDGLIANTLKRFTVESAHKLQTANNQTLEALAGAVDGRSRLARAELTLADTPASFNRSLLIQEASTRTQLAELASRESLALLSKERGLLPEDFSTVQRQKYLADVDLFKRAEEYRQDQAEIDRIENNKQVQIDNARHRLHGLYRQRKELMALSLDEEPARDEILEELNRTIGIAEELISGEQTRHLQITLGKETKGYLPPHDGDGDSQSSQGPADEPIPVKRGRGRPRKTLSQ